MYLIKLFKIIMKKQESPRPSAWRIILQENTNFPYDLIGQSK